MENEKTIISKLEEMGIAYDSLKPKIKDYLGKIEDFIQNEEKNRETALKTLRKDNMNVKTIADTLGLSRTTFYNNEILKDYIEYSSSKMEDINPYETIEELRKSKSLLQDQVDKMVARDVKEEREKHEKQLLEDTIKANEEEIRRLHERINELAAENNLLRKQLRTTMA